MVVTVTREYGCGAATVARSAAELLGYRYVADELPIAVAARLRLSPEAIRRVEDTPRPLGERILRGLAAAHPEVVPADEVQDIDTAYVSEIERAVREAAGGGDCVILGRIAGMILRDRPDLVRIFLRAPLAWRIEQVVATLHIDARTARAEIERVDAARRQYARDRYRIDWNDAIHYDAVFDVSRFGGAGTVELLVAAVRAAERSA